MNHENGSFFTRQIENKLLKACVLSINDSRIHMKMKIAWDDSAVKLACTQPIRKDIRASSKLFTRRAADVISEASFTTLTGDRDDELAAMDLSTVAVALTPL